LPFLALYVGCTQQTPSEHAAAREKVMREVGVAPPAKPTVETAVAPEAKEELAPLAPSIVQPSTATPDGKTVEQATVDAITPNKPSSDPTPLVQKPAPKPFHTIDDPSGKWIALENLPRETWEVQYLGNAPVGLLHRTTAVSNTPGSGYFRHDLKSRMRVSLKGKPFEQRIRVTTIEKDNGELVSIEGSLEMGLNKQTFNGSVLQREMKLTGDENGQPYSITIEWPKEYRGPFAVDQSMLRKPLKPRESRSLKYFDPILRKVIDGRLEASDFIMTPTMLGGSKELLEIRNTGMTLESDSESLLWVDSNGEAFKSYVQSNDILSFRTEPIVAQIVGSNLDLRAIELGLIPLTGSVERLTAPIEDLDSMGYLVRHRSEDPFHMFTDRIGQRIHSVVDPRTVEVTFFQNGGSFDPLLDKELASKVEAGTLAASEFVPSDLPLVTRLAKGLIAADKTLPPDNASNTDKANSCRREIQRRIRLKEFDKQIGTIANSLKTKQANCIEHALLFASVCRSLNIPTRIAMGVKFNRSTENPAMKFHAWIEIRDGERWVPMDSSDDVVPISIDRFKIQETNFNNPNPYLDLLAVYRQLPELSIQVLPR
jgi:hypothetical protein